MTRAIAATATVAAAAIIACILDGENVIFSMSKRVLR